MEAQDVCFPFQVSIYVKTKEYYGKALAISIKIGKREGEATWHAWKRTMGEKSFETLGSKIPFSSVMDTLPPSPPNKVNYFTSQSAQTTARTQH